MTFGSAADNVFNIYGRSGDTYRGFGESPRGLYYSCMKESATVLTINTVEENRTKYSNLDQRRADKARKLQDIVGLPTRALVKLIDANGIPNCPVTRADLNIADDLLGPSHAGLKGKTTRHSEPRVRSDIDVLPPSIKEKYMKVTFGADIMYVNGIRLFITISRHIQFGTVARIKDAAKETLIDCIQQVLKCYSKIGFTIQTINMDSQFAPINNDVDQGNTNEEGPTTNMVTADEHEPHIERFIITSKERIRSMQCTLPFKKLPVKVTIELVYSCIFWWNAIIKFTGVSGTLSPRKIVTGMTLDYNNHCKLQFGEYVQMHEITNKLTKQERTVGALAIRPTGNT